MDKWVQSALIDDSLVVELLLRLKLAHLYASSSDPCIPVGKPTLPPLGWGHRQPRSKAMASKDHREPARRSPTTPLSWSAASASASASLSDGYDDSVAVRSKGTFANETAVGSNNKKSRKKKTYNELKDEESGLLKERDHLEKELASLHVTLNEERSRADNLKRIKLDFQVRSLNKMLATSDESVTVMSKQSYYQTEASVVDQAHLILPRQARSNDPASSDLCSVQKNSGSQESRCFVVPDLNMTPFEDME